MLGANAHGKGLGLQKNALLQQRGKAVPRTVTDGQYRRFAGELFPVSRSPRSVPFCRIRPRIGVPNRTVPPNERISFRIETTIPFSRSVPI